MNLCVPLQSIRGTLGDVKREQSRSRIGPYVDRLMAVFGASANYADAEVQPKRKRVLLYSVGEPTPAVVAIIARAPDMLEVVWRPAPYTCVELCSEVERLMEAFPQLLMREPQDGGAGLEFGMLDRELVDAEDPVRESQARGPLTSEDVLVPPAGFEPATHGLGNRCSIP